MKKNILFGLLAVTLFVQCKRPMDEKITIPSPKQVAFGPDSLALTAEMYYDKVLGALVGSAIGDAMGASTEMWNREAIQLQYGYITDLTPAVRVQSPEGTWEHNLPSGATTDDTRWKYLASKYLTTHEDTLSPDSFTAFILNYYNSQIDTLRQEKIYKDPNFLDETIEKVNWLKEWARVAMAYSEGKDSYEKALHRFYGGELSCAGQLYTPMFGLVAENPTAAYQTAYTHALFDLGYAKDISALVAAMTNKAMTTKNIDSIIATATFVDPMGFQDSRLVGRISHSIALTSINAVLLVKKTARSDSTFLAKNLIEIPDNYPREEVDWAIENSVFAFLEENERAIPFHSGEIWQILITALKYSEGDFETCMQFIVNYGRDNDTVAAVAGMILGAKDGFERLPETLKETALRVNKEVIGINLEELALEITKTKFPTFSLQEIKEP